MNLIILLFLSLSDTENFNNREKKKKPTKFRRLQTFLKRKNLEKIVIGASEQFSLSMVTSIFSRNSEQGAEMEGCWMAFGRENIVKWAEADSRGHTKVLAAE